MTRYLLKRLAAIPLTALGASLLIFLLLRALPGDPAVTIATRGGEGVASAQEIAAVRDRLGLDQPLPLQFAGYVGGLLRLDAGDSLRTGKPVLQEIAARLPVTVELALLAVMVSLFLGLPVGVAAALRYGSWVDYALRGFGLAGLSLPNFWLGTLAILGLSLWLNWIPPLGRTNFFEDPATHLQQILLPSLILGYRYSAIIGRLTRSTLLDVLHEDYIRTARAKGAPERIVVVRHALRNAALPLVSIIGVEVGALLAGTVVIESVFALPGMGRLLLDAVRFRDYPLVQTIVTLMALLVLCLNLVLDLVYTWLNPRVRYA